MVVDLMLVLVPLASEKFVYFPGVYTTVSGIIAIAL
jgi:hypothetical protein